MDNAIWPFVALPLWYLEPLLFPFSLGWLGAVSISGAAALCVGTLFGVLRRDDNLLWTLAAVLLSHAYVALAWFFRGQLTDGNELVLYGFMLVQIVLAIVMVWRATRNRIAAALLAWFGITYALFAAFLAVMAFSNTWP